MKAIPLVIILFGSSQGFVIDHALGVGHQRIGRQRAILARRLSPLLEVWVEEAEDDFVDQAGNLEEGEVCLLSLKAFASDPDNDDDERLLCAGALVRRPSGEICDAWTADAILPNGGPNLQLSGAVKVLDALFLFHLQSEPNSPWALRTFVLQCGTSGSEYSCASYMAGELRGFRRLRDMVLTDSIYEGDYFGDDLDGMVFDYHRGKRIYEQVARTDDWEVAAEIWMLLPDANSIKACTVTKERERDL